MEQRNIIDAHIHLDAYPEEERDRLLEQAFAAGVEAVVAVSMELSSCETNRKLAQRYPDRVHPAYGFHPEQPHPGDEAIDALIAWIRDKHRAGEPFAIGEVGLPYYNRTEAEEQGRPFDEAPYIRTLERFAALAAELDRPLVLHAVYEDGAKACEIAAKHGVRRVHFHWFKGDEATIERMIASGCYISVTPDVAYEPEIQALVRRYPLDLMMAETDGPWPFEGPHAGKQTVPAMAADAAEEIAAIKGIPAKEAAEALTRNARAFYSLQLEKR
ncbi:TatD family hydrolase [Paenibacillus sp. NPDC058071]|uniref:TatD family hydrolase n=1 Tax=Paenibacillus sp. NPDC058071 TaxID=3346326 RepID=UPI0036D90705